MKNQILVIVVTIGCFSGAVTADEPGEIYDLRVYRIDSRVDDNNTSLVQTLTASPINQKYIDYKGTVYATTAKWTDDASQKWRMEKSALYNSFSLHPTSSEDFVLEHDATGNYLFYYVGYWGLGYNKMWYLVDAGENYYMIKNHFNKVCLKANGLKSPVSAAKCDNSIDQQWKLTFLQL